MTSGQRRRLAHASVIAVGLIIATVNAASVGFDARGAGLKLDAYEPWLWEFSSVAYWLLVLPLLWRASRRLRPPILGVSASIVAHLLLTLPAFAGHIAWLAMVRPPLYTLFGGSYSYDLGWSQLFYELRKDVLVALMLTGMGIAIDQWATPAGAPLASIPPFRLEVRDGSRTLWLAPDDIERAEAAGNYVELHGPERPILYRQTLATLEILLAPHGFVRIHRSRLVRRSAITAITSTASGDFEATLASGERVGGSRRFRDGLR